MNKSAEQADPVNYDRTDAFFAGHQSRDLEVLKLVEALICIGEDMILADAEHMQKTVQEALKPYQK